MSLLSPYPLSRQSDGTLQFVTVDRCQYTIYLTDGSNYIPDTPFSHQVVMVGFYHNAAPAARPDERVGLTIVQAIRSVFITNPNQIIVYVCDASDRRQRSRMKLFSAWFERANEGFVHLKHERIETDYAHFAGLLMRTDNSWREAVTQQANQFITDKFED